MNGENNVNDGIETISFGDPVVNNNEGVLSSNFKNNVTNQNLQQTQDIQSQLIQPFANMQTSPSVNEQLNTMTPNIENQSINPMVNNVQTFPQTNDTLAMNNVQPQMVSSNLGVPTIDGQNTLNTINQQPIESISPQFIQADQTSKSSNDEQKSGLGFIIILFVILAVFIFALPYITKLF